MTVVCAIDPGSRETGIIVRRRDDLLAWYVSVRTDKRTIPGPGYVHQVLRDVRATLDRAGVERWPDVTAVEDVRFWPGNRNGNGLLGTAVILGAVCAALPNVVTVDPGSGAGGKAAWVYPNDLRPPGGGRGSDRLRHCRSAWDLSYRGETLWKQQT